MNCPKCNNPLREGAKFCTACGQKIEVAAPQATASTCPQCNAPLREGAKFCTKCG
ncbi:MAG: zinc ribbon domain-containing protein, partial [Prevotella sp.]|nr:zinc ribbon domain-containing protein [Prevotella sp.]